MRALWVCFVVLLFPSPALAAIDWQPPKTIDGVNRFRDVACASPALCLAVGGDASHVVVNDGPAFALGPEKSELYAVECPAENACVAIGAPLAAGQAAYAVTSATPADPGSWRRTVLEGGSARELACPSTTLCVGIAVDRMYVSRNPFDAAPVWTRGDRPEGTWLRDLECPSEDFCALVSTSKGVLTSSDAGTTWTLSLPGARAVSCPSATLCFAVLDAGRLAVWNGTGWAAVDVPGLPEISLLDCPTADYCMGLVQGGLEAYTTTTPAAPAPWRPTSSARVARSPIALACPAVDRCTVVGTSGYFTAGTPSAGDQGWSAAVTVDRSQRRLSVRDVACPSETLCLALAGTGNVYATTAPVDGQFAPAARVPADVSQLACPAVTFCALAVGRRALTTTDPASPAAWTRGVPGRAPLSRIDCPTERLCVSAGGGASPSVSTDGGQSWATRRTSRLMRFRTVSCPSERFCVAAGGLGGRVGVLKQPARRTARWEVTRLGVARTATGGYTSLSFSGLSCPSPRFCAAIDWRGRVVTTTNPGGGKRAWKVRVLKGFSGYVGAGNVDVDCPTTRFCIAVDGTGAAATTRDGGRTWTVKQVFALGAKWNPATVDCASERLCLAGYGSRVATFTPPA